MGAITDQANAVYADGPSGNPDKPHKPDIRLLFDTIDKAITAASAGTLTFSTWAALSATDVFSSGQAAKVVGPDAGTHTDPISGTTVANEGEYVSVLNWGWQRTANLAVAQGTVIFLDASATPDWTNIVASSFRIGLTSYQDTALYLLVPQGENAAGPSLNINGLGAKPIIEIDGSPIFSRRFNPYEPLLLQYGSSGGGIFQIVSPKEQSYFYFLSADPANPTTIAATAYRSHINTYQDNGLYLLFAMGENGADASININGLGLRWVYEMDGSAVAPGRWREGDYLLLQYSSIGFNLITVLNDQTGALAYRNAQEAQQAATAATARIAEMEFSGALLKRTTAGANTFATGTATSVPWEAAEFDVGGWWSAGAPEEVKVPAGSLARGIIIDTQLLLSGAVGDVTLEVEKFVSGAWTYNYLGYSQRQVSSASPYCGGKWSTGFIPASPGDRFRLRLTHTGGAAREFDALLNQSSLTVRAVF